LGFDSFWRDLGWLALSRAVEFVVACAFGWAVLWVLKRRRLAREG
jgi:hypothetical protein